MSACPCNVAQGGYLDALSHQEGTGWLRPVHFAKHTCARIYSNLDVVLSVVADSVVRAVHRRVESSP